MVILIEIVFKHTEMLARHCFVSILVLHSILLLFVMLDVDFHATTF